MYETIELKKSSALNRALRNMVVCSSGICVAWSAHASNGTIDNNAHLSLAPGKAHEVCITLTAQESLRYSFTASAILDFNIHYHADSQVYYPVRKSISSVTTGGFTPETRQHYCLMWTNSNAGLVELVFEYGKNSTRQ